MLDKTDERKILQGLRKYKPDRLQPLNNDILHSHTMTHRTQSNNSNNINMGLNI